MSMTLVPVCWQTTVTAENKKECALAHSRAEARLPRQPSTLAPSAHPRGAFLSYRNEVSYTIKKMPGFLLTPHCWSSYPTYGCL